MPINETLVLCQIVRIARPNRIFEIGTFRGCTTLQMAANSTGQVFTLDLPPDSTGGQCMSDAELDVYPEVPGDRFRGTAYAERIHQLLGDSQTFDFTPYYARMDLVLVDACHHYDSVYNDTQNALKMVSADGIVVWHDYAPYAPGVVRVLNELSTGGGLFHLTGTSLAVYCSTFRNQELERQEQPGGSNK